MALEAGTHYENIKVQPFIPSVSFIYCDFSALQLFIPVVVYMRYEEEFIRLTN